MIAVGGLLAALVLVVAEFTRLFTVFEVGRAAAVRTVATGSHHDFALLPIAALVVVLMVATRRGGGRPALVALAALGILVLVIALLVDLPDAHRTGLIAFGRGFELGRVTPSVGFYLETLAGVLLLIVSGMGLMVGAGSGGRGRGGGRPGGPGAPGRAGQDRPARPRL